MARSAAPSACPVPLHQARSVLGPARRGAESERKGTGGPLVHTVAEWEPDEGGSGEPASEPEVEEEEHSPRSRAGAGTASGLGRVDH